LTSFPEKGKIKLQLRIILNLVIEEISI